MPEPSLKVPFKAHLVADAIVVALVFAAAAYVRGVVTKELKDYVPRTEYADHQKANRDWGELVLKGLHDKVGDVRETSRQALVMSQENNAMLREIKAEMKAAKANRVAATQ